MTTNMTNIVAPPTAPPDLIAELDAWHRPIILGHVRPDADCFGAMFAMSLAWPGDRSAARVSLPQGSISRRLDFLADWVKPTLARPEDFKAADGFVVVDTAKKSRCNRDEQLGDDWSNGRNIINIDHHASNTQFGEINWVDATAGSACELVYRLIRAADRPLSPLIASLLYAGIHSDTVGFSLQTTSSSALQAAADLVAAGARVADIGERLCRSQSQPEFNLNRLIYDNTHVIENGSIAYSTASFDEISKTGCTAADIDDQVEIPRSVRDIKLAILFTEGKPGRTRLNIRGEGDVNALELAQQLGGGGHNQAAGAILDDGIEKSVDRVIPMAVAHLANHQS
jgi:bifunctional oligoribonuclease and PAP phosphatase NrnA